MKLKDQVCSLEPAKELQKLGVKQESYFWWVQQVKEIPPRDVHFLPRYEPLDADEPKSWVLLDRKSQHGGESISAFTVAELGEMLPLDVNIPTASGKKRKDNHRVTFAHWSQGWKCGLNHLTAHFHMKIVEETEANARAKMLTYLLEKNLLPSHAGPSLEQGASRTSEKQWPTTCQISVDHQPSHPAALADTTPHPLPVSAEAASS
jgi:hypothetical protein